MKKPKKKSFAEFVKANLPKPEPQPRTLYPDAAHPDVPFGVSDKPPLTIWRVPFDGYDRGEGARMFKETGLRSYGFFVTARYLCWQVAKDEYEEWVNQ